MQLAEHTADLFMSVQEYFVVYCGCIEVVKLFRLLLSPYRLTGTCKYMELHFLLTGREGYVNLYFISSGCSITPIICLLSVGVKL
jgi:hypothetical protein